MRLVNILFILSILNSYLFSSDTIDLILKNFDSELKAKNGLKELHIFLKTKNINLDGEIKKFENIWYLKLRKADNNIKSDEKFLEILSEKYPNMVIIEDKETIENFLKSNIKDRKKSRDFWEKNRFIIQIVIFLIILFLVGLLTYLRFKTVKKLCNEQKTIVKEQNDIESSLM